MMGCVQSFQKDTSYPKTSTPYPKIFLEKEKNEIKNSKTILYLEKHNEKTNIGLDNQEKRSSFSYSKGGRSLFSHELKIDNNYSNKPSVFNIIKEPYNLSTICQYEKDDKKCNEYVYKDNYCITHYSELIGPHIIPVVQ